VNTRKFSTQIYTYPLSITVKEGNNIQVDNGENFGALIGYFIRFSTNITL
jgi:hypothetical protein